MPSLHCQSGRLGVYPVTRSKLSTDDAANLFPTEQPQYSELGRAVSQALAQAQAACHTLREDWFDAAGLTDPSKSFFSDLRANVGGLIERFVRFMAGGDRTATGYAAQDHEDGLLQHSLYLGYATGVRRGQDLTGTPQNIALTPLVRERLARESFARLSKDGELRFAARLDEIRQAMDEGFRKGQNPIAIAKRLGRDLDGYEQGRIRGLVRTELAYASEAGILDQGELTGVTLWNVAGNPSTDSLCVNAQNGGPYTTSQMRGKLPLHVNCFCTAINTSR